MQWYLLTTKHGTRQESWSQHDLRINPNHGSGKKQWLYNTAYRCCHISAIQTAVWGFCSCCCCSVQISMVHIVTKWAGLWVPLTIGTVLSIKGILECRMMDSLMDFQFQHNIKKKILVITTVENGSLLRRLRYKCVVQWVSALRDEKIYQNSPPLASM